MEEHLVGEFAAHHDVGGPASGSAWDVRVRWEKELAEARLLNISWPVEYGGRGGTASLEYIFLEEHFRVRAPYWAGIHGRDLFGPTLLRFGTSVQKERFLPAITRVEEDMWVRASANPTPGQISRACGPAPPA